MAPYQPTGEELALIDDLVSHYRAQQAFIKRFLDSLHVHISDAESLTALIHSLKKRMKDPEHLKDSLKRKLGRARNQGTEFHINKENLLTEVTDLAGYRILHLHTRQMGKIHPALMQVLDDAQFRVIEGPRASIWDQESDAYFKGIGIDTEYNPRMYSSVHYVVQPNSKAKVTIEIQVRTLSEEVWGEVDHKFNYPHPVDDVACSEQLRVLARLASGCTRLVDSIFASYADWQVRNHQPNQPPAGPTSAAQLDALKSALRGQRFLYSLAEQAKQWELEDDELRFIYIREARALAEMLQARDPMQRLHQIVKTVLGRPVRIRVIVQ